MSNLYDTDFHDWAEQQAQPPAPSCGRQAGE